MAVLAGIDEAGFGPILGPLVVSSSAFSVPDRLAETDLWQILRRSVANRRKHLAGRLLVTDSKKAYCKRGRIEHLRRTVLGFFKCLGQSPMSLKELLKLLCPDLLQRLDLYPWYKDAADYEIPADQADILIASEALKNDLASNDMKFLGLTSRCLDVAHYNRMVKAVKNKSSVLFTATSQLIKQIFDNFADDRLKIIIDRQGGRVHYRKVLQRMFGDMDLRILHESAALSSYELQTGERKMQLNFIVGADMRFLPVSLASMVSKFLRELLVENINCYFARKCADLKPTAGYWKDGLRFIEDVRKNMPDARIDMAQLVRSR